MKKLYALLVLPVLAVAFSINIFAVLVDLTKPVLTKFPTMEPENGEIYRIADPNGTTFYINIGSNDWEDLTITTNGMVKARFVDYDPIFI